MYLNPGRDPGGNRPAATVDDTHTTIGSGLRPPFCSGTLAASDRPTRPVGRPVTDMLVFPGVLLPRVPIGW